MTSTCAAVCGAPSSAARLCAPSALRSAIVTRHPSAASACAVAQPMPDAPPMTTSRSAGYRCSSSWPFDDEWNAFQPSAICALFDAAARAEETRDHVGVREFLATLVAQQIPADTLAERGARGAAVRLLTAHRAKGLEWRLVVVAHVQQDGWPDLRRRGASWARPDRGRRTGPADLPAGDAGRGAAAVLRRLHPGPRAARRHRRGLPGRRR